MIKTIKVKKEFTFRELMEYILENDIRDRVFRCREGWSFRVCEDGEFDYHVMHYNIGETYEVEVEEEISEDTEFDFLVEVAKNGDVFRFVETSISEKKDIYSKEFHTVVDGELVKIWERE